MGEWGSGEVIAKFRSQMPNPLEFHVLINEEDDLYSAHCLEFDIVAEGSTIPEVKKNIIISIINYISFAVENDRTDRMHTPAPAEYWNMWAKRTPLQSIEEINYTHAKTTHPLSRVVKEVEFGKVYA